MSDHQKQTEDTFGFKWKKRETYESSAVQTEWQRWLFEKYFDGDVISLDNTTYSVCFITKFAKHFIDQITHLMK